MGPLGSGVAADFCHVFVLFKSGKRLAVVPRADPSDLEGKVQGAARDGLYGEVAGVLTGHLEALAQGPVGGGGVGGDLSRAERRAGSAVALLEAALERGRAVPREAGEVDGRELCDKLLDRRIEAVRDKVGLE